MSEERTRPRLKLVGRDGNAYAIRGACAVAAREAGWTPDQLHAFTVEATSGDYDHLLGVVMKQFDVE